MGSCIVEKSMSAWATIMKANPLKLPGQHLGSSLEESPFPRKAIGHIVLGERVFFYLIIFRNFLGLVCFISFLNLISFCLPPGGTVSIQRQQLPCT